MNMFDLFSLSKKEKKRIVIRENRRKGKAAEDLVKMQYNLSGYEVERTGKGHDFRVRKRDMWTGRVIKSQLVEVKSGNAKLSKLQRKTKNRKKNYKVVRVDPPFY